jgi:hypothetical protein
MLDYASLSTKPSAFEGTVKEKSLSIMDLTDHSRELQHELLQNIKSHLDDLKQLRSSLNELWDFTSYRFRGQRNEQNMLRAQQQIGKIAHLLRRISPRDRAFHTFFQQIIDDGINARLDCVSNRERFANERQVLKSFFQMTYFLEIAIKYGEMLDDLPEDPPFGWSALLSLYRLA